MSGIFIGIGLVAAAILLMLFAILRAPRGYEDQRGFHLKRRD